jgi:hypothetical protein
MAAVDTKGFGVGNRLGKTFFPDDLYQQTRTFGHTKPIPLAFFGVNMEKSHDLSFLP